MVDKTMALRTRSCETSASGSEQVSLSMDVLCRAEQFAPLLDAGDAKTVFREAACDTRTPTALSDSKILAWVSVPSPIVGPA